MNERSGDLRSRAKSHPFLREQVVEKEPRGTISLRGKATAENSSFGLLEALLRSSLSHASEATVSHDKAKP